jgi:hypothetical protein
LLVDNAAQLLYRSGFAQCQVQRVDVAAAHVQHAADVLVGCHDAAHVVLAQQLQLLVAVAFPQGLL